VKKLIIAIVLLFVVLLVSGGAYMVYTSAKAKEKVSLETATELPSTFINPFVEKPSSGFPSGDSATSAVSELFTEPTPTTYQNPFGSTSSANQPYQNPFETLR
jgi:flagellar basal body-associated protein FliL